MYTIADLIVFIIFLLLSVVIGIYHGVQVRHAKFKHSKADEYLTGGRNLPVLPVCLSLLTTFISGLPFS